MQDALDIAAIGIVGFVFIVWAIYRCLDGDPSITLERGDEE